MLSRRKFFGSAVSAAAVAAVPPSAVALDTGEDPRVTAFRAKYGREPLRVGALPWGDKESDAAWWRVIDSGFESGGVYLDGRKLGSDDPIVVFVDEAAGEIQALDDPPDDPRRHCWKRVTMNGDVYVKLVPRQVGKV